ncbi:hypothetical protein [uncultured Selenomonas sp.]|jgi:hypothetical protein|nr:hypothetical protein [uncultured Selenomonas sp.]
MRRLIGYWRTMRQYAASPKGRHDLRDYLYAGATFLLLCTVLLLAICIAR